MSQRHGRRAFLHAFGLTIAGCLAARFIYDDPQWVKMANMLPLAWVMLYCFVPEAKT